MNDECRIEPWLCLVNKEKVAIRKQWHDRLVLSVAGYNIRHFSGTKELLSAAYDVYQGEFLDIAEV